MICCVFTDNQAFVKVFLHSLSSPNQAGVVLVDVRQYSEYLGKDDIWLRKGHIPGAISFHWAKLMEQDNTHQFKSFDKVKSDLVTKQAKWRKVLEILLAWIITIPCVGISGAVAYRLISNLALTL